VTQREVDVVIMHSKKVRFMGLNYSKMLSAALSTILAIVALAALTAVEAFTLSRGAFLGPSMLTSRSCAARKPSFGPSMELALVTGSSRGLGKAIALELAKRGCDIIVNDVNQELAESVAKEIEGLGRKSIAVKADISKPEEVDALFKTIAGAFSEPLSILVNNAGITRDNLVLRMKLEDWQLVLGINLGGTFLCSQAAAKVMLKQRAGRIVNIASVVGQIGNAGQANYAASKGGVIGLTRANAKEFAGRGVTVNAVCPGFIET